MNVPKLRFKEFKSEIKSYRLDEVVDFLDDKRKPIKDSDRNSVKGIYPYYGASGIIDYINDYIFDEELLLLGEDGANIISRSTKLVFKATGKYWVNNHAHVLRPKNYNDIDFLESYLENINYEPFNTGTAQPKLNQEVCRGINVYLPEFKEQQKIGKMLSLLDKKIELQSKKIEDLKLFKKGLIFQLKMDKTKWNEYKISDIFNITRGIVIPKTDLCEECNDKYMYPVYSSQTSNNGILGFDKTFDFDGKYLTWTTDGANAGKVFFRNGKFRCTNVCGILYNDDNMYVDELTAELLDLETPKHVSYVGNPKLMNNVMSNIKILLPNKKESEKISFILNKINKKIDLEIHKFNKYQELKKGLMQNMFV